MTNKTDNDIGLVKLALEQKIKLLESCEAALRAEQEEFKILQRQHNRLADSHHQQTRKLAAIREFLANAKKGESSVGLVYIDELEEILNTTNAQPAEKQQDEYCDKCGGMGFLATGVHHFGMNEEVACPCTKPAQEQGGKE